MDEGVEELSQAVDGLINHKPPRLSVSPPGSSLRKDAINDLSDWTASSFSSDLDFWGWYATAFAAEGSGSGCAVEVP